MTADVDRHELRQVVAHANAAAPASDGAAARDELGATRDAIAAAPPSEGVAELGRDPDTRRGQPGAVRRTGDALSRSGRPASTGEIAKRHSVCRNVEGTAS